jgi:hypothetical protein
MKFFFFYECDRILNNFYFGARVLGSLNNPVLSFFGYILLIFFEWLCVFACLSDFVLRGGIDWFVYVFWISLCIFLSCKAGYGFSFKYFPKSKESVWTMF